MRKLAWDPDDTHRVTISEKAAITVTDITLTKTTVELNETFDARLFVSNPTGETPWKALAATFGVTDPGGFTPHFIFVVGGNIPIGNTEWVIACNGAEVGTWDTLGCVGYLIDSVFIPENCYGYLDMLTVVPAIGATTLVCITPPPPTASVGTEFDFYVVLSDASGPLQGKNVTWYINDVPQMTSTTNSLGQCLFGGTFIAPGTIANQAKFDGDGTHAPSETVRYETIVS